MAAITAAAIGVAGSVYAQKKASSAAKAQNKLAQEGIAAADPYAPYRKDAAAQLDALQKDPSSITGTAEYKARQTATERQLAAQGYTGSGNAIIEAAEAGGKSYQQAFDNLAMLSGATTAPGGGYDTAQQAMQAGGDQKLSSIAGITNNLANLASQFNKPVQTPFGPGTI